MGDVSGELLKVDVLFHSALWLDEQIKKGLECR